MIYEPGDIGFSASNTFLSKAIRFFTSLHTSLARKSHTFTYLNSHSVIESLSRVRINPATKYDNTAYAVSVYRLPLSLEDRGAFAKQMPYRASQGYGWTKIPMFALDGILTKITSLFGRKKPVFFFTKNAKLFNIPVCSQFIVWGLHKYTSYELKDLFNNKVDWRIVSPDYLEDLLRLRINGAELIFSREMS